MKINLDIMKTMRIMSIALLVLTIAIFFSHLVCQNDYKELKEELKDIRIEMKIKDYIR